MPVHDEIFISGTKKTDTTFFQNPVNFPNKAPWTFDVFVYLVENDDIESIRGKWDFVFGRHFKRKVFGLVNLGSRFYGHIINVYAPDLLEMFCKVGGNVAYGTAEIKTREVGEIAKMTPENSDNLF